MNAEQETPTPSTPPPPTYDAASSASGNTRHTAGVGSSGEATPAQSRTQQPPTQLPPAQPASSHGGRSHRSSVTSPGPFSSWSASSDKQLGYNSGASDFSDRVFPIRSVISVESNPNRGSGYFPSQSDPDSRGIPVHVPSRSRTKPSLNLRRSNTQSYRPMSPSPMSPHERRQRRSTLSPTSNTQANETRHGSIAPLQLDISTSDKEGKEEDEESGPLGAPHSGLGHGGTGRDSASASSEPSLDIPHVTARFTHVEMEDGHSVITGRDGILQRCEDEPIHTPGAVQGFGAMVAVREENDGRFVVRYVSENSEKFIRYSPRQLFSMSNFLDILTEEQQDNLLDHIDFIRDEDSDPSVNGPEVFSLSIRPPKQKSIKMWCAIHINPAHPDLIICEFELDDDQVNPLRPADELTPDYPQDTLDAEPTLEEIEESTEILSKPLRILRSARKRRAEQGAMQVFDIMSQIQEQLASAQTLDVFLKILVGIVKELTGFHRIMIYQFDSSFNGKVVTELVDPSKTRDLYKGLHFPATDIPRQARDLYKLNKVRLLYDRDLQTARLVCRSKEDLETPLDMSHSYLRAMSPIHLKYLGNMEVRSSMSISVNAFNELWGLIACHSYGSQGMRVSFPIRKMCRLIGDTASRNIERLSYASRLQARKLINTSPTDQNPSGYIVASSDDLLRLFDADFGLLSINDETKILGPMEQSQEALAMLEYLRMRKLTSVVASHDIREDFLDLRYPPGFQVIAGLLYVPLSVGGNDFIVFFRRGQVKEVKWAGNPYEKIIRDGTAGYLEPRTSFKTWHETVIGKCREWNEEQIETAAVLCLVYGKFIEVWRQKEAALQSSKLTRLLLANSAHEVRTPLNAIINYLEIAMEGTLDQETRENLARSHSASKSLIYVINDLLDLTKAEEGQNLVKDEVFELSTCITEATDPFHVDAKRKGINYAVSLYSGLPRFVQGDSRRVRQAISNIAANAIAHTTEGHVAVEVFVSEIRKQVAVVDFAFTDSGSGMSTLQLDALFRDLEQVSTEESGAQDSPRPEDEKRSNTRTLGLGLAVVARIVRTMDGQLRLKSEEGQGSRFVVSLPFHLPDETPAEGGQDVVKGQTHQITRPPNNVMSAPAEMTLAPEGEITLVDRGSAVNVNLNSGDGKDKPIGEVASTGDSRRSMESHHSQGSQHSAKSDADRLIDAIQTPLSLHDKKPEYPILHQDSDGSGSHPRPSFSLGSSTSPRSSKQPGCSLSPTQRTIPGQADIKDSKTPIKAIKVPDDYQDLPAQPQVGFDSRVLFEISSNYVQKSEKAATESVASGTTGTGTEEVTGNGYHTLQVLVAEDDPINMKILRKRLERLGHTVVHAVNGQDCASNYAEKSNIYDVILMDMQMPIVDGLTSTRMIRAHEKSPEHRGHSALASVNRRIPIFAVSASLIEAEKDKYVEAGFDGWILKPIDFKRLNTFLGGIHDEGVRHSCLYVPGEWERGGWFVDRGDESKETTPKVGDENKDVPDMSGDAPSKVLPETPLAGPTSES